MIQLFEIIDFEFCRSWINQLILANFLRNPHINSHTKPSKMASKKGLRIIFRTFFPLAILCNVHFHINPLPTSAFTPTCHPPSKPLSWSPRQVFGLRLGGEVGLGGNVFWVTKKGPGFLGVLEMAIGCLNQLQHSYFLTSSPVQSPL